MSENFSIDQDWLDSKTVKDYLWQNTTCIKKDKTTLGKVFRICYGTDHNCMALHNSVAILTF